MSTLKIKLEYSQYFLSERKKYLKHDKKRFDNFKKSVMLFVSNPIHPSLNTEKLHNTKSVYTIRLNKSDRIFFTWKEKNTAIFIDVGKHDKYKKY